MDRLPTKLDLVAGALQLVASPACACDPAGVVVASNAELRAMLGTGVDGSSLFDLFAASSQAEASVRIKAAQFAVQRWQAELAGSALPISVQIVAKPLPSNAGASFVFTDIGQFEVDQAALQTTLLEQKAILDNAAVGIMLSANRVIKECNIRAAQMFGYAAHELIGMSSLCVFPSVQAYEDMGQAAGPRLAAGQAFTTELELRRKDGQLLWCRLYGHAVDPDNPARGVIWILEDVNDAHHNEVRLRRALLEMRVIMDNAPVAIAFQREHTVLRYNRQFAQFFQLESDAVTGLQSQELYASPADFAHAVEHAELLFKAGKPLQGEHLLGLRLHLRHQCRARKAGYDLDSGRSQLPESQ